jgi:hypothetical protein
MIRPGKKARRFCTVSIWWTGLKPLGRYIVSGSPLGRGGATGPSRWITPKEVAQLAFGVGRPEARVILRIARGEITYTAPASTRTFRSMGREVHLAVFSS